MEILSQMADGASAFLALATANPFHTFAVFSVTSIFVITRG